MKIQKSNKSKMILKKKDTNKMQSKNQNLKRNVMKITSRKSEMREQRKNKVKENRHKPTMKNN